MVKFDGEICLENNRVRLEKLSKNHFEPLLSIAIQEPDLLKYSPSPFGSAEKLNQYFLIAKDDMTAGSRLAFAIYDKKAERYAGSTSYGNISFKNGRLEIGWTWIAKEFQRTGLNRNCKALLLSNAFDIWNLERVELKTDARNERSWNAIEALGAKHEGTLRSHTLMNDGHRRDTAYFSILKNEWAQLKGTVFKNFFDA